jgi:chromosome segregation ATPase
MNNENTLLKGRLVKFEEINRSVENEAHANRSTIQQMANQLHIHEQNAISHRLQIDAIKAERDVALNEKEAIKKELETLHSRLDSVQKAWQNTRGELDQRENKYSSHEQHLKQLENEVLFVKSSFDTFKQQVGQLLSDNYVKVEPKEDEIKNKIQLLMQSSKDRGVVSPRILKEFSSIFSSRLLQIFKIKKNN